MVAQTVSACLQCYTASHSFSVVAAGVADCMPADTGRADKRDAGPFWSPPATMKVTFCIRSQSEVGTMD